MNASKEDLIKFLDENVLIPAENHPMATATIKKKVHITRIRLNEQVNAEKVKQFFWSALVTDRGIDSYKKIKDIDAPTFEDVREEFKRLCGDR